MSFQPYPNRSGLATLGAAAVFGVTAFVLTTHLLQQSSPPRFFIYLLGLLVALGLTLLALHWALIAFKLDYHLNRNGLAIQWGLGQQLVPFAAIKEIIPGKDIPTPPQSTGLNIAGLRLGRGELLNYGPLKFRATAPLAESLLIITPGQAYVISPRQPDRFLQAWRARQELGPTQHWSESVRRRWPLNLPIMIDPLTWWLLGAAALLGLALFGYISINYPELPRSLPVHFNSLGQPDRIADKSALFILPTAGGLVWLINAALGSVIYNIDKFAAYLLWGSAIGMQLCLWIAAFTLII